MSVFSSTSDQPTPDSGDDAISPDDALAHTDQSTEELADQEYQDSYRQDTDSATYHDRVEEGRIHSRSEGDRGETGSY
jgi:hypothetical protein